MDPALLLALERADYIEFPGMRGLRIAQLGRQQDGRTLEIVEAVKGVVIPMLAHPAAEHGKVLSGRVRFMHDGDVKEYGPGDTWDVPPGQSQGPHVILEDQTRIALLRDGRSALDIA
jgi:quercetin dioxygenase-like cupin family protein